MNNSVQSLKVHVTGLEEPMRHELSDALRSISCHLTDEPRSADIVFCGWDPNEVSKRISAYGCKPVVIVSRLPDVSGWLDALEAGAVDYCASPFEPVQLRWILEAHLRGKVRRAAA